MKKFLLVFLVIVVIIGAGVLYLFQPRSLGISYTPADLENAHKKLLVIYEALPTDAPANKTLIVSGAHPIDQTFTSAELSALADTRSREYAYFPFRNVQIRVNTDGTVEGSATINYSDAVRYLTAFGVSRSDIAEGTAKFKIPNANLPVYLKASGIIAKNQSQIAVAQVQIAHIPVPLDLINKYVPALNDFIGKIITSRQPSYNIEKLDVLGGNVHFVGTAPDKEQAVKSL